jgi:hypothetical protein
MSVGVGVGVGDGNGNGQTGRRGRVVVAGKAGQPPSGAGAGEDSGGYRDGVVGAVVRVGYAEAGGSCFLAEDKDSFYHELGC